MSKINKAQSQCAQILAHLSTGKTLTIREAWDNYGIQSLTRRIADLRAAGHDIETLKTIEGGMGVSAWRLRRGRSDNPAAPFAKGDKVRVVQFIDAAYHGVRIGMVGEVRHIDRRDGDVLVDIGGRELWFDADELEKVIPMAPGTVVVLCSGTDTADHLWIAGYSLTSDSYVVRSVETEFQLPAKFVKPAPCHAQAEA